MKTCFVVMAFNRKTDYQSGRTLDMDKSYRLLIKPAVQECGLECVRADEIVHSGVLDVPMYEKLLEADLVVADLSTANPNAMYELGVRHALRPFSTVVIAESKLQYPFNVAHTAIRSYQHLGDAIDYEEVLRFRAELKEAIQAVLAKQEKDSPVYTYLPSLRPPSMSGGRGLGRGVTRSGGAPAPRGPTLADMLQKANESLEQGDFAAARRMFRDAHGMRRPDQPWTANDDFVVQQVAFATLMSRTPGAVEPLEEARHLLEGMRAPASQDPATVELWGGISKALWDETHERDHMEDAVAAYERTFCLRGDYESGITLAFLLNARAALSEPAEAIADFVQARRVRRQVAARCEKLLGAERPEPVGLSGAERETIRKARYRVRAALAEAHLGLGNRAEAERWRAQAFGLGVPDDWKAGTVEHLSTLATLLEASPLRFLAASSDSDSNS
jgi:hypothetical protein